jgi:photosystem II stability/assembly factor-like uncharacterized protein
MFKKNLGLCLVLFLFCLGQAGTVWAGAGSWQSVGPEGGYIRSLALNAKTPAVLFASNNAGVFKTSNGGKDWETLGLAAGLPNATYWCVTVDPQTPTTVYAVSDSAGALKSTDSGASWKAVNNGLDTLAKYLVIDPSTPSTLYTGTWVGVYKSIDGGANWTPINKGLTYGSHVTAYINVLAIDPQAPNTLYAGTYDGGVFITTDGGKAWSAASQNLGNLTIHALVIDPLHPAVLYAGTKKGVYKSTGHGDNWTAANNGLPADTNVLSLAIDPQSPETLYVGTRDNGVFVTTDGGQNWAAANDGLGSNYVNALAFGPAKIYAGTAGGGVFALGSGASQKIYLPVISH